jgi:ADP-heptose:LPS heptosyltransferase
MTAPRFTISVLCHNKLALTQACLRSIIVLSRDYEVIVTDNASTDDTPNFLTDFAAKHTQVRVIRNDTNKGFKEPHEHALTLARGEFFVLLNNDMTVCPGWLEGLAKPFEGNPKMALTGVAGTCNALDASLKAYCNPGKPEYVEGSCLMIPTALARRIGLFAPWLQFIYWEDTELGIRVRELGYEIALVPLAMKHDRPGSTSKGIKACQDALIANTKEMETRYAWYWKRRDLRRRILVRRLGAHGDVLLATPALWELKQRYPQAEIDIVTKCPVMLKGLSWLDFATKARSYYDEFYDLDRSYEERPDLHIVEAFALKLGVTLPKRWQMHMATTDEDEAWAERVSRGAKLALIHPGYSCWPGKNWPVERFEEVAETMPGWLVATVGDATTPRLEHADLHLAGQTTPQQLYALAKRASLFIGIDSMPQHVASAADCPSVVLFGPTNPKCITRPTHQIVAVQADVRRVPCVGEHGRRTKPITQAPCDGACMKAISVEMVLSAVKRVQRLTQ